jgi:hypothetical protein
MVIATAIRKAFLWMFANAQSTECEFNECSPGEGANPG